MTSPSVGDAYDPSHYPPVAVTVDVVVFTLVEQALHVVLVTRGEAPFPGAKALPGGFVKPDESLDEAADRELREETGVDATAHLEQLAAYGAPKRDPRMRVITVAYLAVLRDVGALEASGDAAGVELVPVADVLTSGRVTLAFDHEQILRDAVEAVRTRLEHTSLGAAFVGPEFTLRELRTVYEAAWQTDLDPGNFRRSVLSTPGFVEPTGTTRPPGREGGKPAEVYRAPAPAAPLERPLRRPAPRPKRGRRRSGDG